MDGQDIQDISYALSNRIPVTELVLMEIEGSGGYLAWMNMILS